MDVPEYEQLLDQDPDRVEKLGRILQQKFNMFKSDSLLVPGDRSFAAAVSATEGNWVSLCRLDVNNNNNNNGMGLLVSDRKNKF